MLAQRPQQFKVIKSTMRQKMAKIASVPVIVKNCNFIV